MKLKLEQKLNMLKNLPYKYINNSNIKKTKKNTNYLSPRKNLPKNKENLDKIDFKQKSTFFNLNQKKENLKVKKYYSGKKHQNKIEVIREESIEDEEMKNQNDFESYSNSIFSKNFENLNKDKFDKIMENYFEMEMKLKENKFINEKLQIEILVLKKKVQKLKNENSRVKTNNLEFCQKNTFLKKDFEINQKELFLLKKNIDNNLEKTKFNYEKIIQKMVEEAEKFDLEKINNLQKIENKIKNLEKENFISKDFSNDLENNINIIKKSLNYYITNLQNNISINDYELLTFLLNIKQKLTKIENNNNFYQNQLEQKVNFKTNVISFREF